MKRRTVRGLRVLARTLLLPERGAAGPSNRQEGADMELNKAVLDCMQSLRRRLREELSVDIRLSQPDAVEAMLLACLRFLCTAYAAPLARWLNG